jgi:Zn finger protein HypA/HybF involved in hydrogenase expression
MQCWQANSDRPVPGTRDKSRGAKATAKLLTMLPTDAEAMFGRTCPKCHSYFRTQRFDTEYCPYCDADAGWTDFITQEQLAFLKKEYEAIIEAFKGPDGETTVNFDAQVKELTREDSWIYSEEKQQTHFACSHCKLESDVLGEYVRCPGCGVRTARAVITRKIADFAADFEKDVADIPAAEREQRQRRWKHYVPAVVAEFEALGRDIAFALSLLPLTPSRRKAITELAFQNPTVVAVRLKEWFGFDILEGMSEEDRTFLLRMFNRRHLFTHSGGKVDQEYLNNTADTTVRLNEIVSVSSRQVRRLIQLVQQLSNNLLQGFESIA